MSCAMAVDVSRGIHMGRLFERRLLKCGLTHREAADAMQLSEGKVSEAIDGERPLDLWKLRWLPLRFWQGFLADLAGALVEQWIVEQQRPYRMVKADLKRTDEKERVS